MTGGAAAVRAPRLMLIVDTGDVTARCDVVVAALAAGVDTVQLRDRHAGGGALLAAARTLRDLTRVAGTTLLVNERIDVARAAGADGVHLPAASFPIVTARRLLGPAAWIGRSTHAASEARAAADAGADYVVLGPIFATPSKAAYGPPLGVAALADVSIGRPLVAIGGVTPATVPVLRAAGAHGVAVIRAILDANDPVGVVHALRSALD